MCTGSGSPNVGQPSENHLDSEKVAKTPKDEPEKQLREKGVWDWLVQTGSCLTDCSSTVWEKDSTMPKLGRADMQSLDIEVRKSAEGKSQGKNSIQDYRCWHMTPHHPVH